MPRIRQNAERDAMNDFLSDVKGQMARHGYTSQKALGKALGLCQGTVGNYLTSPGSIRLDVLKEMCKTLKLDPITILRALGFSSKDIKKSYMKEFES